MKRTPWFPASTPPVHPGWYEVKWVENIPSEIEKQVWLEVGFYHVRGDRQQIIFTKTAFGEVPGDKWRGLAEPPSNVAGPGPAEQRARPDEKGNS